MPTTKLLLAAAVLVIAAISLTSAAGSAVNVYTQRIDNRRSGVNTREASLNHQTVRTQFGRLWTLYSDAKVMAQPLYVTNLKSTTCPNGCNTVIFCSMKGTIYAYKADVKPTSVNDTLVWARYLGDPRNGGDDIDMWSTDDPWWGIFGTPVIDASARLLYVVAWNQDNNYRLHAIDLRDGHPAKSPVVVQGSIGGRNFQSPQQQRKQRAALLLDRGLLYVAFGGDNPDALAGWLFVYRADTLQLVTVWSPVPSGKNGGLWMSGYGPAADSAGNVYIQTGNGDFDPPNQKFGDSLLKLRLHGSALKVEGYFAPCDQDYLDRNDLDLGSAGPLLLPGDLVAAGGKGGDLHLMRRQHLAGHVPPSAASSTTARPNCSESPAVLQKVSIGGHIHGTPLYWKGPNGGWVYLWAEGDSLKAFPFINARLATANNLMKASAWRFPAPSAAPCGDTPDNWMPGGFLSISSDGAHQGTGIVWALVPANGDANSYRGVKGMLLALNAENVAEELWRSQGVDASADTADSFGLLARFALPTIANGKVFVGNAGDREDLKRYCRPDRPNTFPQNYAVVVYGLR